MRRLSILIFLMLIVIPTALAESPREQSVIIDINDDGSSSWDVGLKYSNTTENSDFFVLAYIKNVQVFAGNRTLDCRVNEQGFGTLIQCDNIKETSVRYTFTAFNLARNLGTAKMFSYPFLITGVLDEFNLTINLPLGAGLVEEGKIGVTGIKPFNPDGGTEGSDGRKIFVKWFFVKPKLGQSIEVSVIYEQIFGAEQIVIGVVIVALLMPVIFFIFFFRRKGRIEQVLPVLNENERSIMKILLESGGEVDQRKIVRECDMSKSKITRVVKDLEERGLITVTKRGRSNKLRLTFNRKNNVEKREHDKKPEPKHEDRKNPGRNPFYSK